MSYPSKLRIRWWAFTNWLKGYKFSPVGRFRCCDHTTPYHYQWCAASRREEQ